MAGASESIKIEQHVHFEQKLVLDPFLSADTLASFNEDGRGLNETHALSQPPDDQPFCIVSLFAVVVHKGGAATSGHYYTYVKATGMAPELWYLLDDSSVQLVDFARVRAEMAYMLFYEVPPGRSKPSTAEPPTETGRSKGKIIPQQQFVNQSQVPANPLIFSADISSRTDPCHAYS